MRFFVVIALVVLGCLSVMSKPNGEVQDAANEPSALPSADNSPSNAVNEVLENARASIDNFTSSIRRGFEEFFSGAAQAGRSAMDKINLIIEKSKNNSTSTVVET